MVEAEVGNNNYYLEIFTPSEICPEITSILLLEYPRLNLTAYRTVTEAGCISAVDRAEAVSSVDLFPAEFG
jgi:hypothetical protein